MRFTGTHGLRQSNMKKATKKLKSKPIRKVRTLRAAYK